MEWNCNRTKLNRNITLVRWLTIRIFVYCRHVFANLLNEGKNCSTTMLLFKFRWSVVLKTHWIKFRGFGMPLPPIYEQIVKQNSRFEEKQSPIHYQNYQTLPTHTNTILYYRINNGARENNWLFISCVKRSNK